MSQTHKEFLRFSLVTPFVGLTDAGVYLGALWVLPHAWAKALSFLCGALLGYWLNRTVTFRSERRCRDEVGRYFAVQVFLLGLNVGVNAAVLALWPGAVFPGLAAASLSAFAASFVLKKWWVKRANLSLVGHVLRAFARGEPPDDLHVVGHWQGREIRVTPSRRQVVQCDGEALGEVPFHVRVVPGALDVLVPKKDEAREAASR